MIENFEERWRSIVSKKIYGKMIFSSSPDRGLGTVLYLLPFIKEHVPEVTLDIYYGFDLWRACAQSKNDTTALKQIDECMRTIDSLSYVKYHGKIPEPQLAKQQLTSYCWLYFDSFHETHCITANQFQLSATPSVTSNVGALQTTVGEYGIRILHHPGSREGRQQAVDEVVKLHKDRKYWELWSKNALSGTRVVDWESRYKKHWKPFLD